MLYELDALTYSQDAISRHCCYLARSLYKSLVALRYPNGAPVVEIYVDDPCAYGDPSRQGATFAFNIMRQDGTYVPWTDVEKLANDAGVYIRAGGMEIWLLSRRTLLTVVSRCLLPRWCFKGSRVRGVGVEQDVLERTRLRR